MIGVVPGDVVKVTLRIARARDGRCAVSWTRDESRLTRYQAHARSGADTAAEYRVRGR
jgi:hypothetical protein